MSQQTASTAKLAPSKPHSLTQQILKANMAIGQKGETLETQYIITPAIAKHILEKMNGKNRLINETHAASIVRDIRNGNWITATGGMVSFDKDGNLVDGQHRLRAVVTTNTSLRLSLKFGLSEAAKKVIDTGRKRTHADWLAITEGKDAKYRNERSALTRMLFGFLNDQSNPHSFTNNNKPTQSDLSAVSAEYYDDISEAVEVAVKNGHLSKVVIPSYGAFVYMLFKNTPNADKAKEFLELLGSGANLAADNPIMVVRNRLMARDEFRFQKNKDRTIGLLIKAWNHWVQGESMTNKTRSPNNIIPVVGLTKIGKVPLYQQMGVSEAA